MEGIRKEDIIIKRIITAANELLIKSNMAKPIADGFFLVAIDINLDTREFSLRFLYQYFHFYFLLLPKQGHFYQYY